MKSTYICVCCLCVYDSILLILNCGFSKLTFQREGEIIQNNWIFGHSISPVNMFSWVFRIIHYWRLPHSSIWLIKPWNLDFICIIMHCPMRLFVSPHRATRSPGSSPLMSHSVITLLVVPDTYWYGPLYTYMYVLDNADDVGYEIQLWDAVM